MCLDNVEGKLLKSPKWLKKTLNRAGYLQSIHKCQKKAAIHISKNNCIFFSVFFTFFAYLHVFFFSNSHHCSVFLIADFDGDDSLPRIKLDLKNWPIEKKIIYEIWCQII